MLVRLLLTLTINTREFNSRSLEKAICTVLHPSKSLFSHRKKLSSVSVSSHRILRKPTTSVKMRLDSSFTHLHMKIWRLRDSLSCKRNTKTFNSLLKCKTSSRESRLPKFRGTNQIRRFASASALFWSNKTFWMWRRPGR